MNLDIKRLAKFILLAYFWLPDYLWSPVNYFIKVKAAYV